MTNSYVYGPTCEPCGSLDSDPVPGREDVLGFGVGLVRCRACGAKRYPRAVAAAGDVNDGKAAHLLAERTVVMGAMDNCDPARAEEYRAHVRTYYRSLVARIRTEAGGSLASLFEVGFNVGDFLLAAEAEGVAALGGCEPNGRGVDIARRRLPDAATHLHHAFFRDAPRYRGWDAVALLDVLEHTEEPRGDLERARELLRPGGVLLVKTFFDEFHDGRPAPSDRASYGDFARAGYHDPLGHLWHFDREVLRSLIKQAKFRIVSWEEDIAWGQATVLAVRG